MMFEEGLEVGCVVVVILIVAFLSFAHWEWSEDLVSGIVYNNVNSKLISGNTSFEVRAAADMYADENTSEIYCLPPNSQYIPLVKKAAADKKVRVVVSTKKDFKIMLPWQCMDNVVVELEK
jgi:hypothetical protein